MDKIKKGKKSKKIIIMEIGVGEIMPTPQAPKVKVEPIDFSNLPQILKKIYDGMSI